MQLLSLPYIPSNIIISLFNPLNPITAAHMHKYMRTLMWSWTIYLGQIPEKKIDFTFLSSDQLPIDSRLGVGLNEPLPMHVGSLTGLILCKSCVGTHGQCESTQYFHVSYILDILCNFSYVVLIFLFIDKQPYENDF